MSYTLVAGLIVFFSSTPGVPGVISSSSGGAERSVVAQQQAPEASGAGSPVLSEQDDLQRRTAEALQRPTERNEQADRRVAAFWFVRPN